MFPPIFPSPTIPSFMPTSGRWRDSQPLAAPRDRDANTRARGDVPGAGDPDQYRRGAATVVLRWPRRCGGTGAVGTVLPSLTAAGEAAGGGGVRVEVAGGDGVQAAARRCRAR